MADDTKENPESKEPGSQPAPPEAEKSGGQGPPSGGQPPLAADPTKPAGPGEPVSEKPAPPPKAAPPKAAGERPAAPVKKAPSLSVEISGDALIDQFKSQFGGAITEAVSILSQQVVRVKKESYLEFCRYLQDNSDAAFDMCADLTVVHWPTKTGEEFEIVVQLYSVSKNRRLRVKTSVADGEACPSITPIWAGADWMEREAFDMYGVRFDGHPDLRRILLPSDWPGYPLRKEYPIEYRDNEWTDRHLEYREIEYDTSLIDVKYRERR